MNIRNLWGKKKAKKWVAITLTASSLALLPALGALATTNATKSKTDPNTQLSSAIKTVYHVYVGNQMVGTVDNRALVTTLVNDDLNKAKANSPHSTFMVSPSVTTISEKTFDPSFNNQSATTALKDSIKVVPAAVSIVIDGKPVATVQNQSEAKQAIESFAQQFVSKNVAQNMLNQTLSSDTSNQSTTASKGTYSILEVSKPAGDVSLKQTVTFEKVPADSSTIIGNVNQVVQRLTKGDLVKDTYKVKSGDVLGSIASQFGLKLSDLLTLNPSLKDTSVLKIGQDVVVKKPQAFLDLQVKKKVSHTETISFPKKIKQTDTMYKGQKKVLQQGKAGQKRVTYEETITNGSVTTKSVLGEKILSNATTEIVEQGTKVISSRGTGIFQWPTHGGVITSPFGPRWGRFHKGIDIAGVSDHTIMAADNGVVVSAGWNSGGYGNRIVINHNNGFETTYNHLSQIDVHQGQVVRKGEAIGVMGETGDATGVHLHFEVYKNGQLMNPSNFVHR